MVANAKLTEKSRWFNERRQLSFLSATNLLEAKPPSGGTGIDSEPKAAASIQLSFEESDKKLRARELEQLLKRFVNADLLQQDIADTLNARLRELQKQANNSTIAATVSISLGIPSAQVIEILDAVEPVTEIGLRASPTAADADPVSYTHLTLPTICSV